MLFLLIFSCNNDNCDMPVIGESFTISDSTRIHLSNYFESEKVVFINSSTAEEVEFEISDKVESEVEFMQFTVCPENPDEVSPLIGTNEFRQLQIENAELEITITIQHQAALAFESTPQALEQISFFQGELNELNQPQSAESGLLIVTPSTNDEIFALKSDVLTFAGIEFFNVEEINPANTGFNDDFLSPNLEIAYTLAEGIIYINDDLTNSELVFDRLE